MTRVLFKFIIYPSCERALKNGRVKSKVFRKSSLKFTFGQGICCLISDFANTNSDKVVLVQIFLRFEIVILNKNFAFCVAGFQERVISSFCSIAWVAGWILPREIIKRTGVFYPVCLKKYWKKLDKHPRWGLFCESCAITHHSLFKVHQTLC